jgi:hypothetical protein
MVRRRGKYNAKAGWRDDLGIYARSMMEANYARYLQHLKDKGEIQDWQHEPFKAYFTSFGYSRGPWVYVIDFQILNNDGSISYVEVKGRWNSGDKTKIKRFIKHVSPNVEVVMKEEMIEVKKELSSEEILHWES